MSNQDANHPRESRTQGSPRWARLQSLLFSAGAMGTAIAVLSLLAETKLPRQQGE